MADENEFIAQEIYEYYQNNQNTQQSSPSDSANTIADLDIIQTDNTVSQKIKDIFWDRKKLLILSVILAVLFSVLCGYVIGLLIPKSDTRIAEITKQLEEESESFQKALSDNERLSEDVDELYDKRAEKKAELNNITDYEEARDLAKSEFDELLLQFDELQTQITEKKDEIAKLDALIKNSGGGEIILTPGMYTAGKHIAAGSYSVTGNGSLLVSDSQNKLKINTKLTASDFTCPLSDGDIIKLETEAKFNPAD